MKHRSICIHCTSVRQAMQECQLLCLRVNMVLVPFLVNNSWLLPAEEGAAVEVSLWLVTLSPGIWLLQRATAFLHTVDSASFYLSPCARLTCSPLCMFSSSTVAHHSLSGAPREPTALLGQKLCSVSRS